MVKTEAKEETCTVDGNIEYYTCSTCGKIFKDEACSEEITLDDTVIKAHHLLAEHPAGAPDCTHEGNKAYVDCHREGCGYTTFEAIPALGHDWGEWTVTTSATCTENGVETRVCKRDANHVETRAIPATGHSWGEWKIVKEPTETEAGIKERACVDCGEKEQKSMRAIKFVNIEKMYYMVNLNGKNTKIASETVTWEVDAPLTFTVYTTSLLKYTASDVEVKLNGVKLTADENGYYTIPAGVDYAVVTMEEVAKDDSELTCIEKIFNFFKKILLAFAALFGSCGDSSCGGSSCGAPSCGGSSCGGPVC